mgnify:CR=1 FL=1
MDQRETTRLLRQVASGEVGVDDAVATFDRTEGPLAKKLLAARDEVLAGIDFRVCAGEVVARRRVVLAVVRLDDGGQHAAPPFLVEDKIDTEREWRARTGHDAGAASLALAQAFLAQARKRLFERVAGGLARGNELRRRLRLNMPLQAPAVASRRDCPQNVASFQSGPWVNHLRVLLR